MLGLLLAASLLPCLLPSPGHAQERVKIGVLSDQSGVYSDAAGPGSMVAAQIAVEEFQAAHPATKVTLVSADHQNKPDLAIAIAGRWLDTESVDMITDLQNSGVSLAVQKFAGDRNRITITTGSVTPELYNAGCTATGIHWAMDAYALTVGPVQQLRDRKKWFFITVDLAGGHLFEQAGMTAVRAMGGEVVGNVHHPLGTADMSSYLLAAQARGVQALALADAGTDAINAIKGASEFGLLAAGVAVTPLLFHVPDVKATGLQTTQGMIFGSNYYWDENERTRRFAQSFMARFQKMPTDYQANTYAAVRHYLAAVAAVGSTESGAVMTAMRDRPVDLFSDRPGTIRPDGRVTYDTTVVQVKTPAESKGPWDLVKVLRTIPADQAFPPLSESRCPLLKH
ncbi:MAG: ABC transporter substrate-binding protein [Janthinobacterium lividum]